MQTNYDDDIDLESEIDWDEIEALTAANDREEEDNWPWVKCNCPTGAHYNQVKCSKCNNDGYLDMPTDVALIKKHLRNLYSNQEPETISRRIACYAKLYEAGKSIFSEVPEQSIAASKTRRTVAHFKVAKTVKGVKS